MKNVVVGKTVFEEQPSGTLVPIGEVEQNGQRRTSWTAVELLADEFPAPRFAVPGLVPEGLTFFAGAPKLGKSWLALGVGLAIAAGGRVLGSLQVEAGDVLYLALEDSPRRLKERLGVVLDGEQPPTGLHFHTDWPRLGAGGAEQIEVWLVEHPSARLVVIDVFTRIRAPEVRRADLYRADYEAAAELQGLAISRGIAIVAIYHTRKAEAADFVEMVQGPSALPPAPTRSWSPAVVEVRQTPPFTRPDGTSPSRNSPSGSRRKHGRGSCSGMRPSTASAKRGARSSRRSGCTNA
jgi:hypothetical protein